MRNNTSVFSRHGFTIVELLVVIVVIAILASISIVAYNGVQARANDAKMRTGVSQIEKALQLYALKYPIRGGFGSTSAVNGGQCNDGKDGFIGTGSYTCTIEDALTDSGQLPRGFTTNLPKNTYYGSQNIGGKVSVMLYECGKPNYALYWTLQSPTPEDAASLTDTAAKCGQGSGPQIQQRDSWGMRAAKIIQL